jgi:hypothetical protein
VLPIIALFLLVSVEWGGWVLLKFLTEGEEISRFKHGFFRAGHAHAGVLLTLSLVYFLYLDRTDYSHGVEWAVGFVLLAGILVHSGGFFLHVAVGRENEDSLGTRLTRVGAIVIGAALVVLAIGLIRAA